MMKMIHRFLFVIVCIAALAACTQRKEEAVREQPAEPSVNERPALALVLSGGKRVLTQEIDGRFALILFQPDCDHCQREADDIARNLSSFRDCALYFVSSAPMDEIEKFAKEHGLAGRENVHFAQTGYQEVLRNFGAVETPSIYLYSAAGELVQSFNGEVAIEVVLKYL